MDREDPTYLDCRPCPAGTYSAPLEDTGILARLNNPVNPEALKPQAPCSQKVKGKRRSNWGYMGIMEKKMETTIIQ